jgi:alkylated DNA repair dioxygenase AlkB
MSASAHPLQHTETWQRGLFEDREASFDREFSAIARVDLGDGAWIEHQRRWITGHESVLEALWESTRWQAHRRRMYERVVDVPRLVATLPDDGPGHPLLDEIGAALAARYGRPLHGPSLAAYRDGRDSVAFHGDRLGRHVDDSIVAIAAVGEARRFLLKPVSGGASIPFDFGRGDLLVMGGRCQETWLHGVPKVARAGLRISIQFRSAEPE